MDDFSGMFFDDMSELNYNDDEHRETVHELIEYLAYNVNMIVAYGKGQTSMLEKIEFYIKTPGDNGGDGNDDNDGGTPIDPLPVGPRRPVEFEMEA
jgi:hypothetical protein